MWNPEDTHKITESIYKNITNNFNQGVRQILTGGKAYHKALVGMTSSAHCFIEAVGKVGYACQINGQGGTDEIGAAILKLADIQKEMFARVEECTKALFSEVILPLEHRLENDFKHAYAEHKKYQHGHKGYLSPYVKAQEALKKFRKKSKSRFTYDESKEAQYVRAVAKCQEKLTDFRTQGLKLALLEERKCYCYLLERLTSLSTVQSAYTKKGYEMLAAEIPYWKQLSSQPHILPRAMDPLVVRREQRREALENSQHAQQNGMVYGGDRGDHGNYSPYHRPVSSGAEFMRQKSAPSEYAVPAVAMQARTSKTLPRGMPSGSQNPPPPPPTSHVTAIYAHVGRSDDQLSFNDGDMISLIGEKSDGWQYGFNANTAKYGWFPLSFTDVVNINRSMEHPHLQRAKSIGDLLDSKSHISDINTSYEIEMPGRNRRPRSLYESSMPKHANSTPQSHTPSPLSQWSNQGHYGGDPMSPYIGSDTSSAQASSGFHTLPRPMPMADLDPQDLHLHQPLPDPYYDPKPPGNLPSEDPPAPLCSDQDIPDIPPPPPPYDSQIYHSPITLPRTPKHVLKPLSRNPSMLSSSGPHSPSLSSSISTLSDSLSRNPSTRTSQSSSNMSSLTHRASSQRSSYHEGCIPPPLPPQNNICNLGNRSSFHEGSVSPPPPPPPPPPPSSSSPSSLHPNSCVSTHLSQMLGSGHQDLNNAHTLPRHHDPYHGGQGHHHMQAPPPQAPPPPPVYAPQAPPPPLGHGPGQQMNNSFPPPPPPPTDYNTDDEEEHFKRSQMFANVSLRKTQTNDRSAPRLN